MSGQQKQRRKSHQIIHARLTDGRWSNSDLLDICGWPAQCQDQPHPSPEDSEHMLPLISHRVTAQNRKNNALVRWNKTEQNERNMS